MQTTQYSDSWQFDLPQSELSGIGRVCTRPARTRATKEKMARCSQERLCWHGPDCTRRECDSSCPRQRRLETIHSQAAVACPCRSIAKALSQSKSSQELKMKLLEVEGGHMSPCPVAGDATSVSYSRWCWASAASRPDRDERYEVNARSDHRTN